MCEPSAYELLLQGVGITVIALFLGLVIWANSGQVIDLTKDEDKQKGGQK